MYHNGIVVSCRQFGQSTGRQLAGSIIHLHTVFTCSSSCRSCNGLQLGASGHRHHEGAPFDAGYGELSG